MLDKIEGIPIIFIRRGDTIITNRIDIRPKYINQDYRPSICSGGELFLMSEDMLYSYIHNIPSTGNTETSIIEVGYPTIYDMIDYYYIRNIDINKLAVAESVFTQPGTPKEHIDIVVRWILYKLVLPVYDMILRTYPPSGCTRISNNFHDIGISFQ